jgi:hypothetical protein
MIDSGNPYPHTFVRSPESREFEVLWRSLRGPGRLVPGRTEFQPARARRFLRDLVLMEAPGAACPTLRIRLTGRRFDETIGFDISGRDHLEFMAPEFHAAVLATAHAMVERPCGLWQITPAHLVRGHALNFEITAFPLAPDEQGRSFIISHVRPVGDVMSSTLPTHNGLGIGTAVAYAFLDIGAGAPALTAYAA